MRFRAVADRQPQREARASSRQILRGHPSAVGLDDADGEAETETRALARALRREERVEDASQMLGWNTGPVVLHLDHDLVALAQRAYAQQAAAGVGFHRVGGVGEQVQQHLLEL